MGRSSYLPKEIVLKIISMVDDIDLRRSFGIYYKINMDNFKFLNKIIPKRIYYKWEEDVNLNFNPQLTPIYESHPDHNDEKTYQVFDIRYEFPNFLEEEERRIKCSEKDIMDIRVKLYSDKVDIYSGIYKIKKKEGFKEKERFNFYYKGDLNNNYYWDWIDIKYKI